MRSPPNGAIAGVRVNLDADGDRNKICLTSQAGIDPTCEGPWRRAHGADPGPLQRLHDGGRAADRLGLVLAGPRRPDRQVEDRQLECGTYSCFVWYIDSNPQDIDQIDYVKADGTIAMATPGDERQLNDGRSTPAPTPAASTSTSTDANRPALLHPRQAHRRRRHPALQGRRPLARGRGPADARRELANPVTGTAEGFETCTSRSRTRAPRRRPADAHPQDADGVPRLRSTACRRRRAARAGPRTSSNALATAKFGETLQVPVYS